MSSAYPTVTIDLVLDRSNAKEVLRAMMHAILFHRLFGLVKPKTFDILDVTLPGVSDAETERMIDEKVDAFWRAVDPASAKRGQIVVTLSEKKPKKTWFPVYAGEEEIPWEQWVVNAELRQPKSESERQASLTTLSSTLSNALRTMLTHTSSEKGKSAVPPITSSSSISPFPFSIVVKVGGVEVN